MEGAPRGYGEVIREARTRLNLSIAGLQRAMGELGHKLSVQRLEQLEYDDRALNVRGRQRLQQIAETLRSVAKQAGWGAEQIQRELSDSALFPGFFAADGSRMSRGAVADANAAPDSNQQGALVNSTILFVDLMNSVALSTALSLWEYNDLISDYQAVLREVLYGISGTYPVGEFYLGGDQLAVFFYDPADAALRKQADAIRGGGAAADAARLAELDSQLARHRDRALYGALACAVAVKNAWIAHPRNVLRVETDQPVLDVGIGINTGNVVLQRRGDGTLRIEGFAINFAKRVEGFSRHGRYCRIMLSRSAYETFRGIVVGNVMLKQRAFFQSYTPGEGTLKGLSPGTEVFELKFFHRLAGFAVPLDQIGLHRDIFENDPTNIWAYTNLMNFHLFSHGELDTAQAIAHRALYANATNEKIFYDLGVIHQERGELDVAREYALQCVRLNDQMDIGWHLLGDIDLARGAKPEDVIPQFSRALTLSPQSADLHMLMALQLKALGRLQDALRHYEQARQIYPEFETRYPDVAAQFASLVK